MIEILHEPIHALHVALFSGLSAYQGMQDYSMSITIQTPHQAVALDLVAGRQAYRPK